jgi:hypothetical protein
MAQQLSNQVREADGRVAKLETELAGCRERADRAEEWLHRIYGEIEECFAQQGDAATSPKSETFTLTTFSAKVAPL